RPRWRGSAGGLPGGVPLRPGAGPRADARARPRPPPGRIPPGRPGPRPVAAPGRDRTGVRARRLLAYLGRRRLRTARPRRVSAATRRPDRRPGGPPPWQGEGVRKYVIMGVQGSGKGTQSAMLASDLDLVQISVGDTLRWHIQHHTKLGAQVRRIVDA